MSVPKIIFLISLFAFSLLTIEGQQTPLNPISYRIFSPFILNPAIAGSKDYSSINAIVAIQQEIKSQMITIETRLSKTVSGYFTSRDYKEFRNIGIGGSVFNDLNGISRNIGASAAFAYHIPLNEKNLSFLSFGTSIKGIYNTLDYENTGDSIITQTSKETFFPNLDFGVYYYGTNFFAGLSSTNLMGNPEEPDSLGMFEIPVSRQYFFITGYKFLLLRSLNIVLEPSIIVNVGDTIPQRITDNIHPVVKLYLMDFCFGTYFSDKSKTSFFFQYRYPRFYIGAYFQIPNKSAYYLKEPIIEITAGINISRNKLRIVDSSHW